MYNTYSFLRIFYWWMKLYKPLNCFQKKLKDVGQHIWTYAKFHDCHQSKDQINSRIIWNVIYMAVCSNLSSDKLTIEEAWWNLLQCQFALQMTELGVEPRPTNCVLLMELTTDVVSLDCTASNAKMIREEWIGKLLKGNGYDHFSLTGA